MTRRQREAIDAMLRSSATGTAPREIGDLRAWFVELMAQYPVPATHVSRVALGGRPAVALAPLDGARPGTILYFHGGSYVLGSPDTALSLTAHLVTRTGMGAVSLDYRLAPEHPFPAAIDDGVAAYRELLESGVPASSVAFAGDSAGGGIAISSVLAARTAGLPMPAAVVGFSPGLDQTRSGASLTTRRAVDPLLDPDATKVTGAMYLGGADPHQELLAPAVYADMSGYPPLLLQVGTHEILLDDSVRLAERARDADVDVILDVTAGVPHVFQSFAGQLTEADHALDRAALFLTQHVDGP